MKPMTIKNFEKEPLIKVLKSYPLEVKKIQVISYKGKKGVWVIHTNQGEKILKKSPSSRERLSFIVAATKYLISNGVFIPAIIPTRWGTDFVEISGSCFVLSEAVKGHSPSYESAKGLKAIMKTLGQFHKASRGFQSPLHSKEREHLGLLQASYEKQLNELKHFKDVAKKKNNSFSKLFLQKVDHFIEQGNEALSIIKGKPYTQWVGKILKQKNLCHQDFAAGNLIQTKKGVAVIDMDSLTYDLPSRDLRKILNKVMKKKGWKKKRTINMLADYHSVHPLSIDEYKVLYAELLFPNLFYGISSKYFQQREKEWSQSKHLEKLKAMIVAEKSKEEVLSKWNSIIKKVLKGKE